MERFRVDKTASLRFLRLGNSQEKEQEAEQQKAYKESLKKIPDSKASVDPWGTVRSPEPAKTATPAKPKTKTGSTQTKTETR